MLPGNHFHPKTSATQTTIPQSTVLPGENENCGSEMLFFLNIVTLYAITGNVWDLPRTGEYKSERWTRSAKLIKRGASRGNG
jgi:hypothetical protein